MNNSISFSKNAQKMKSSKIRELMKYASMPGIVSLAGGLPDPENFPFDDVNSIINKWNKEKIVRAMQYGATTGYPPLINKLKSRMINERDIDMTDQEILVTTGGQQAIFILSRIFLDSDDKIIVEQPTFIGAVASFLANNANMIGINLEDDGINIIELKKRLDEIYGNGNKIKFLYTIPNFQNPAGVTLSQVKRKALYDLALKYDFVIIEDDPYSDLYFTENNEKYKPIKAIGNEAKIIYLGSFSKILCPGFRLGWMVGDSTIIDKAALAKQSIDACSSSFGQVVAFDYLELNLIDNYLEKMRKVYKKKKDFMVNLINKHIPAEVKATNPDGGFFIYLYLPDQISAEDVFKKSFENKVAFVTGEPFHIDPVEGNKHIRLSYSNSSKQEMQKGIEVIGKVLKEMIP